jgi:outer membrane protein assembly factor BamE
LLAAGALLATGCVYKMNIQQGNYLVADSVSQLKEGMTRSQVRFLLGTPMVIDSFDADRWDYVYSLRRGHERQVTRRHLVVWFDGDKVARVEEPLPLPRPVSATTG